MSAKFKSYQNLESPSKLATLFQTIELVNLFIISLDFFWRFFYHGFLIFFFI